MKKIALIGNPNCGKTTIFNWLTGGSERVGNWSGVTTGESKGRFLTPKQAVQLSDLPGIYTTTLVDFQEQSLDERLSLDALESQKWDMVINVVDGTQLARHLYLTLQLLERGLPVLLLVNMADEMRRAGQKVDADLLAKSLSCPVVFISAAERKGLDALKSAIDEYTPPAARERLAYPAEFEDGLLELTQALSGQDFEPYVYIQLLEGDKRQIKSASVLVPAEVRRCQKQIEQAAGESADILIARTRYERIDQILALSQKQIGHSPWQLSTAIDQWVLNRWLAAPIFIAVLYSLFFFAINVGGSFQPFFELGSRAFFVDGVGALCEWAHMPQIVTAFLASGIGLGISTTVTFVPVIGAMFLVLSFLEDSGYMARAAFVVDRLMQSIGLPGKSFVPMIVGFGCNVPAVMAARTLENKRDRILTTMMMPFMSCGARLAIYTVFVAAFFQNEGAKVVLGLYLLGILMAVSTGLLLKKTLLPGKGSPMIMELPPYRFPRLGFLWRQTMRRLKTFLKGAGVIIIPVCVLLGSLNAVGTDGSLTIDEQNPHSVLAMMGRTITPIFSPMGISEDNWPATVGLLTGVLAKEVVVGSLNILYLEGSESLAEEVEKESWMDTAWEAVQSLPLGWQALAAGAPTDAHPYAIFGEMNKRFKGQSAALAYLIFVLLYMPCVSTVAAMVREIGRRWAILSVVWTTLVAYSAAVIFYQLATFMAHPSRSMAWILLMLVCLSIVLIVSKRMTTRTVTGKSKLVPTPIVIRQ